MVALMRWNVRNVIVLVLLVGLAVALTGFGGSPQGSTGTFTAPTDVAAAFSDGSITVSWTPGSGAASQVIVVVNVLDDTDFCLENDATGVANSYQCAGRTEGETYTVLVIALDGQGGYEIGRDSQGNLVTHTVPAMMADAAVLAAERAVLVALYNATGGANWTDSTNWLSTGPIGEWHGVTTDASGRVTELDLRESQLIGMLPVSLGNLSNLEVLNLSNNQLRGQIPSSLSRLFNLTELYLGGNQLTGSIPTWLDNLTNLEDLVLSDNRFSGSIPSQLGNLSNLARISLRSNRLSGSIPPELGSLANLTYMSLRSNRLSGSIPPELGNLTNLQHLYLWGNGLTGTIPTELGVLTSLERLYLNNNQVEWFDPVAAGQYDQLEGPQSGR